LTYAEDYEVVGSTSSGDYDSRENSEEEEQPRKRKRNTRSPQRKQSNVLTKKRKVELRENMTKLTKDQIVTLVCDLADQKPVTLFALEKGVSQQKRTRK